VHLSFVLPLSRRFVRSLIEDKDESKLIRRQILF
jgi:hypothetical protein